MLSKKGDEVMKSFREDLLFWTSIMRDHAIFQIETLAPKEKAYIQTSMYFRDFFQQMFMQLETSEDINMQYPKLLQGLLCFIDHKKKILKGLLTCNLQINLSPSLINHQINEAMEFKAILTMPKLEHTNRAAELANYIKIWLADGIGHAASLMAFLDPTESLLVEKAKEFKTVFTNLSIKADESHIMLSRTGLKDGSLKLLAEEAIEWLEKFICFLEKIKSLRHKCKAMGIGSFSPLIPDHFIREHMYFISKIKEYMEMQRC